MKFKELKIKRMGYGEYSGQIIAELDIEGESMSSVITIQEPDSIDILKACAKIVAMAGAEQATQFQAEFLNAIKEVSDEQTK